ncbi:uncharacterized protein DEA37_0014239 [Paragonimus westermani]|uniref:Uncharacterized protein n=1 Tax=Paragonimus westermani TaxID=34504 RepID=A0A5J4NCA5_9TREM|nr:uncharacterized protein DEA37_0014239 [Paragonimus westermani]
MLAHSYLPFLLHLFFSNDWYSIILNLPKKNTLMSTTEVPEASLFCSPMVHTKTSVKKNKKRRPVISPTPLTYLFRTEKFKLRPSTIVHFDPYLNSFYLCIILVIITVIFQVFNDSNLYSTEKQFMVALTSLEPLPQKWESGHILSCKAFTDLAMCILQCSQGRMPDCLSQVDIPVEAVCLMRQGHYDQAVKICHGYAIEMSFSLVETHLTHMTRCIAQLKTWLERLSAIERLSARTHQINQSASRELSDLSLLVLWPAVIGETQGLLSRLEQDIGVRRQILAQTASSCTAAESAHRLALVWRHLGTLVRWTALTDMVDHILVAICQK